jgi:ferrous iron transport protein B
MGTSPVIKAPGATVTVAICGNPNCGKTTIFNAITGLRQRVANYPGVTVEKTTGQFRIGSSPQRTFTLIDIPGTYSLAAFSPDEYIAAQALFGGFAAEETPDIIVCVIDATNLERSLYLLFQVAQIGRPVIVALNMIDLVERSGVTIDKKQLSRELGGVPVIPVIASRGTGIDDLTAEIGRQAERGTVLPMTCYDPSAEAAVNALMAPVQGDRRSRAEYLRVLFDVHGPAEGAYLEEAGATGRELLAKVRSELSGKFGSLSVAETGTLTTRSAEIVGRVVTTPSKRRQSRSAKVDRYLLHPILGPILLVLIMTFMFQAIFSWAEPLMGLIDYVFGGLAGWVGGLITEGPLRSLLTDGVIGGVGSVLVFLPQIIILFLFIALLEDSGYMPRIAFLVDRAFSWCGLSGKSFIPMLSSYACAVPGIMATRTIEDKKLRFMTILVAPLMTCSARLPVYAIMIAAFIPHRTYLGFVNSHGLVLGALYLLGLGVAVIVSLILKKTLLKTQRGTFMMEFPSYKVPTFRSVLIRVYHRAQSFVLRAGTVILAITVIIWALSYYPRSDNVQAEFVAKRHNIEQTTARETEQLSTQIQARAAQAGVSGVMIAEAQGSLGLISSTEQLDRERARLFPAELDSGVAAMLVDLRSRELDRDVRLADARREQAGAQLRNSYLGQIGRAVEPVFAPLGWDWRVTMAVLASFPAREVIIATLGTIFNLGSDVDEGSTTLVDKMRAATRDQGVSAGQPLFTPVVALSIMVFFALCCQCGATVVTIRQETGSWTYAAGTFVYMTGLAYLGAFAVYQIFSRVGL